MKRTFVDNGSSMFATIVQSGLCKTIHRHRPNPSLFYFPGLTSKPVWDSNDKLFQSISEVLKANYNEILQEYNQLRESLEISPVGLSDYDTRADESQKLHQGKWDWNSYILKGVRQANFTLACPKVVNILESFNHPRVMTNIPFSYTFFSTLSSNSIISPHYGPCNLRIRCHYPLIIPKESGIRIGGVEYQWIPGQPLFFDDTYEHEGLTYVYMEYHTINS